MNEAAQAPVGADNSTHPVSFQFSGQTGEFFGIWIVNILLSVVTLGIYSAWAKVRTRRYFYGHTSFCDSTFDYTADPVVILKGRLIGFALLMAYFAVKHLHPNYAPLVFLILWAALPWLIVRSRIFNARNTTFRNVRFNFTGTHGESAIIYFVLALASVFTAGLLYPYFVYRQKRFYMDNHHFGGLAFAFNGWTRYFYWVYLGAGALLVALVIFALFGVQTSGLLGTLFQNLENPENFTPIFGMVFGLYLVSALVFLVFKSYLVVSITNYVLNHSKLGDNQLHSTLRFGPLISLYFTNLLAIMLTLGLAIPWARIRMWRYRITNTGVVMVDDLDSFINQRLNEVSATGEEIGEAFDFETGF